MWKSGAGHLGYFEHCRLGEIEGAQPYQGAADTSNPATFAPPRPVGPFIGPIAHQSERQDQVTGTLDLTQREHV